jgi:hypothetical protein
MTSVAIVSAFNLILVILLFTEIPILGTVLLVFWLVSILGTALFHRTGQRAYAVAAIGGFVLFLPISLIGMYGVRQMMNDRQLARLPGRDTPQKEYGYNQKLAWAYLLVGIGAVLAEIVLRLFLPSGMAIAGIVGVGLIIAFFFYRRLKVLRLYPDYFILQLGPMASPKVVSFRDIEHTGLNEKYVQVRSGAEKNPLKISWSLFNKDQLDEIKPFFETIGLRSQ